MATYREHVLEHYKTEASAQGLAETSTMADLTTRKIEINAILRVIPALDCDASNTLEIGCGNGVLQQQLRASFPQMRLTGIDFSAEMIRLAQSRGVDDARIQQGDVMNLAFEDGEFDLVVGERVVINLMDRDDQRRAFSEIARVLTRGGYYIAIEAFLDGLTQLNEARSELGLEPNVEAHHNLWFEEDWFRSTLGEDFEVLDLAALSCDPPVQQNFLSTYYFWSRVVYPALTRRPLMYNTHFVRFFADDPPRGNYAPIQLFVLQRI